MRRLLVQARWLWLGLLWLSASSAHAQLANGFTLQLHTPEHAGCIDAATLTDEVEARTGRSSHAQKTDAAVSINVRIAAALHGYRANVSIQNSERELVVEDNCSQLNEMLVLVIASSLGISVPEPVNPEEQVAWKLDPPRAAATQDSARPLPASLPTPETPQSWQLQLSTSARMLTEILPRPAFAPALALLAQWGALGLRAGASWLPRQSHPLRSALALSATGALGELGVCGRAAGESRFLALFCANLAAGAIRASVEPLRHATPRWDALVMLMPHAEARLQLSPSLGIALALGAAIPLISPRYLYGDATGEKISAHTPELGLFAELALWLKIHP